jgi:hypothetical protein
MESRYAGEEESFPAASAPVQSRHIAFTGSQNARLVALVGNRWNRWKRRLSDWRRPAPRQQRKSGAVPALGDVRRQPLDSARHSVPRLIDGTIGGRGLAGVFSTPLYLAGVWHIFEASKPGGTRWSLPPFLLLVTAFSIAPFVHGSFFYVAEILKTIGRVDPSAQPVLVALATRATVWLFVAYGVLAVLASVGFVWLTAAIARGKTLYPRWVALANPLVCMLAALLIDRVLPQPFELLLAGAGLSLGMLAFFALSTAVLWNSPLSVSQAPKSPFT